MSGAKGDHPGHYVRDLETLAAATPEVVTTGFQSGTALAELYAHAGLFVLPSSHEGLPMVLLEATVAGLPVLASDIPANREGSVNCLKNAISAWATSLR